MSRPRFVTGLRAVEQLLEGAGADIKKLYIEYRSANPRVAALIDRANDIGVEVQEANRARLRQISGEARHQGVVAEIRRSPTIDEAALRTLVEERLTEYPVPPLLLLVLDGIQDPHNLGACLRAADAVGVDAVVLPRHGAAGPGPTVSKVAAGAAEAVTIATVANLSRMLSWLSDYAVTVVGTCDEAEDSLYDCDLNGPVAIVMGGEHKGLRKGVAARCTRIVSLPMYGEVASLNVSVATGVCLYEVLRQRRQK